VKIGSAVSDLLDLSHIVPSSSGNTNSKKLRTLYNVFKPVLYSQQSMLNVESETFYICPQFQMFTDV